MKPADTSRLIFRKRLFSGQNQSQESKVYCALQNLGPMTRRQIARATKIELNTVCARVNRLIERELLEDPNIVDCPISGEPVKQVRIKRVRKRI